MEMDWQKETSGDYEVYPAGSYQLRLTNWERAEAKNANKTKQIKWTFEIVSPDKYKGKTFVDFSALTEAALWRTANLVNALGVDMSEAPKVDTDHPAFEAILNACKERLVYATITEETYNGKQNNKVGEYQQDTHQAIIIPEMPKAVEW